MISLIAALDRNGGIGRNNDLLFRIPTDLARFRELTWGHHIVMGRKTYESIGSLLPGRTCWVLTRTQKTLPWPSEVGGWMTDPQDILQMHNNWYNMHLFVIGGAEVYEWYLPHADRLLLTKVNAEFVADTFFPCCNPQEWFLADSAFAGVATFLGADVEVRFETYLRQF